MTRPFRTGVWVLAILALLALRAPAWVAPVGSDQYLYLYVADRLLEGGVPYVDAWDQKPPAVFFVYGLLRSVWPGSSVVALADMAAAAAMAWALIALGRQTIDRQAGWIAAGLALLFGHPSISRLSGVYIRGQCEAFIAPALTWSLVLLTRPNRERRHVVLAGVLFGLAFWLKYNALAYAAPLWLAILLWPGCATDRSRTRIEVAALGLAGFLIPSAAVLVYFGAHGALLDLWLATIDYNLQYSRETYRTGLGGALAYIVTMPIAHARVDFLWFLGLAGGALFAAATAVSASSDRRVVMLAATWMAAAVLSIAVNGARDLPQYFVQAVPAFAFAAAAGSAAALRAGSAWAAGFAAVALLGLWKVGVDAPSLAGFRWGGVPQLVENVRFDARYLTGAVDTRTYLARFKGVQKYDALATYDLTALVERTTDPSDRILVFGFAPGVYVESHRKSASRFFWSRPVIVEFAADRPGFGSAGLAADLERHRPALVALQKKDWTDDEQSADFFLTSPVLRDWLASNYTFHADDGVFSVWRRNE